MMRRPAFIARQSAHPSGWIGRLLLRLMARETSFFNREVILALDPHSGERILEVGFGHGRTLREIAVAAPGVRIAGIDIAPDALRAATRRVGRLVPSEQLDLRVGSSEALPWEAESFDKALAVHTLYFWREPSRDLRELHRVLRPGGTLLLGFRDRSARTEASFPAPTYRFYLPGEVSALLCSAGFTQVEIQTAVAAPDLRIARARR